MQSNRVSATYDLYCDGVYLAAESDHLDGAITEALRASRFNDCPVTVVPWFGDVVVVDAATWNEVAR